MVPLKVGRATSNVEDVAEFYQDVFDAKIVLNKTVDGSKTIALQISEETDVL